MGRVGKDLLRPFVSHVDLDAFENLQIAGAVLAGDYEGTSSGFALVLHHSADADRAVELGAEKSNPVSGIGGERKLDAEDLVEEGLDLVAQLTALR